MEELKTKLKKEVSALYLEGVKILEEELEKKEQNKNGEKAVAKKSQDNKPLPIKISYQSWYSKALPVIKQLLPERYQEFQDQYKIDKRKEIDFTTYTISDYLIGLTVTRGWQNEEVVNPFTTFVVKFQHQLFILNSATERIDSILANIEGVIQSELFNSEIKAAWDLHKKKHLRAAGALAGVTLEAHLKKVCENHGITFRKKSLTITDFNDALKSNDVIDTPVWRNIQHLGDIRNMCVHSKERDPTGAEVEDLIRGVERVTGTIF